MADIKCLQNCGKIIMLISCSRPAVFSNPFHTLADSIQNQSFRLLCQTFPVYNGGASSRCLFGLAACLYSLYFALTSYGNRCTKNFTPIRFENNQIRQGRPNTSERGACFKDQPLPIRMAGTLRYQIFGFLPYTLWRRMTKFDVMTHTGRDVLGD